MNNITHILGKSMPRSGHHFLVNMLKKYFEEDILYCEHYRAKNCCHSTPCQTPYKESKNNKYFFQKGHDHKLRDDILEGYKYIIQYRSPVERMQSDFDLFSFNREEKDNESYFFNHYAINQKKYFINFYNKWIKNPPKNSIVVLYDDIINDKERQLKNIIQFIDPNLTLDENKIKEVIREVKEKTNYKISPKNIRRVEDFRYYDKKFFEEIEREIKNKCEGIRPDIFNFV